MQNVIKHIFIVLIIISSLLIVKPLYVYADEDAQFKTIYEARYTPHLNGDSDVDLSITIINARSDVYVREFSLSFPSHFSMAMVTAKDDYGNITPLIDYQEKYNKVTLPFSNPSIGKNAVNRLHMRFVQKNLFQTQGNIWEVIIPTVNNRSNTVFNLSITLPEHTQRTLSIAKPKPSHISENTIFWKDVKTRTIYAVFGDKQYYTLRITYTLKNDELRPAYYDIALPPETAYQKIVIHSLKPEPEKVYFDQDNNTLARYTLSVKEEKKITLKAEVSLFVLPQDDMKKIITESIATQKNYLLDTTNYWDAGAIGDSDAIKKLHSPEDIYRYVTTTLIYNYSRINNNITRLGASAILAKPDMAVCTEFTDLFIALARKKGILTREVEGYGFSPDQNLRPLSLVSDILHTWPEYYDEKNHQWIPIDPTWENTSGIDYFSAFDLNHIALALHGKDQSYPLPAGMYKISDNVKDIEIVPSDTAPDEKATITLNENIKREITDNHWYKGTVQIKNTGTIFLKNATLGLKSDVLAIEPQKITFDIFAPYQTKEVFFTYRSHLITQKTKATIAMIFNGRPTRAIPLTVTSFYQDIFYKGMGITIGILIVFCGYITLSRLRKKI